MNRHERSPRVFISASYDDREFAASLSSAIQELGAQPVSDEQDLSPGEDWSEWLRRQLQHADLVVFVLPSREGEGKTALFEVGAAKSLGKPIIVVIKDWSHTDTANTQFAVQLANDRIIDASRKRVEDVARSVLATSLH